MSTTHKELFGIESVQRLIRKCALGTDEFHKLACVLDEMTLRVQPRSEFLRSHETSTFVRLDSEIQLGDRSGTPTHKGAKQVPGHSITFSHDALNIDTKILILLRHDITPIHLRVHFAIPTGIQHLHVRL